MAGREVDHLHVRRPPDRDGPEAATELLGGIPGAFERAALGREQGERGETIPLDEL